MKRRLALLLMLLIAGAIVNTAAAWVIAALTLSGEETGEARAATEFDDEGWVTTWWEATRYEGFATTAYGVFWMRGRINRPYFEGHADPSGLVPGWSHFEQPTSEFARGSVSQDLRMAVLRGWPFRSLACTIEFIEDRDPEEKWSMAISAGRTSDGAPRLLPLRPLWPGFVINTFFYAFVLGLLLVVPRVLRRRLRRRRGQCEACGYPIGTSPVCTECGARVVRGAVR